LTLIGVSSVAQLEDGLGALAKRHFTPEKLTQIDR
jgi:aryl-alcohol dehydrogenase-like predicted oxidoreductase